MMDLDHVLSPAGRDDIIAKYLKNAINTLQAK
jgi:hypothetical protein